MALVLADRVLETCTSPGTGAVTLLGATTGYQSFSNGIGDGNTCYYCIADQGGANWEVGIGTYASSGNTLTRTTPISGSSTTPVDFSSGNQNVFVTYPAEKSVNLDSSGKVRANSNSYLDFAGTAPSTIAGRMWYNSTTGSWNLGMGGGNITQQVGEETYVYGKASSAISGNTILQLIFKTGVVGASGDLQFAPTTAGITDSNLILGVGTEDISAGDFGRITAFGVINGINTSGSTYGETWASGDVLWYNPTTGGLTKTKPTAPAIKYQVGTVLYADATAGTFQVDLHQGSELGGTDSNVQFSSVANNNLLQYNSTSAYWTNVTPGSITGVGSVANAVTFNNGGAGAASGTTFDGSAARTISYNTIGAQPAGTYVTSVTGTSPVVSSGGTTPAISMPQASGSVSGYLSSTDWTTFNNKTSNTGTVTSVSGTGTTSGLTLSGTVTTSGSLTLSGTVNSLAAGTYGIDISGNAATASAVAWGNVSSKPASIMYYAGFTLDANTMPTNSTGFTYAANAPYTGPIADFSAGGSYDLQINAQYSGGTNIAFRTRNGDAFAWNSWYTILNSANYASYSNFGTNAVYGGIFYDGNNTGYYLDPNGTSNLYYVSADRVACGYDAGVSGSVSVNNWFRTSGANGLYYSSYGRGVSPPDGVISYGNNSVYGTGLNGWQGWGVNTSNNCVLMSNGTQHGFYNPVSGVWIMVTSDAVGSNMTFYGNVTAYSDLRLKTNVREIDNVIERRNALAMSAIKYERDGRTRIGYGAQTLRDNGCQEFVHEAEDDAFKLATGTGTLSVDYGETTAVLAVASKMSDDKIAALEERIAYLENLIKDKLK